MKRDSFTLINLVYEVNKAFPQYRHFAIQDILTTAFDIIYNTALFRKVHIANFGSFQRRDWPGQIVRRWGTENTEHRTKDSAKITFKNKRKLSLAEEEAKMKKRIAGIGQKASDKYPM